MNDIFEDSVVEVPDISKKNWATVSAALKKHNDDMGKLRSEFSELQKQFNALFLSMQELDTRHTQMIASTFDGGPTAE